MLLNFRIELQSSRRDQSNILIESAGRFESAPGGGYL